MLQVGYAHSQPTSQMAFPQTIHPSQSLAISWLLLMVNIQYFYMSFLFLALACKLEACHRSLPARPLPRARRDSVATPPTGLVAGLARAYTASCKWSLLRTDLPMTDVVFLFCTVPKVDESLSIASTLSQFPSPPRPPLPPIPVGATSGRPVSRLDRSKYPFA